MRDLQTSDRWEAMRARRQGRDESIMFYFHEKVRLCRSVSLSFVELRDYVLRGIYKKELAMYALGRTHINENELLNDLLTWTRMCDIRTEDHSPRDFKSRSLSKNFSKSEEQKVPLLDKPEGNKKIDSTFKTEWSDKSNCWRCRKSGHWSRDCPSKDGPKKCFSCGEEGHIARACTVRTTTNALTIIRGNAVKSISEEGSSEWL